MASHLKQADPSPADEPSRVARARLRRILLLSLAIFLPGAFSGCDDKDKLRRAAQRGTAEGLKKGHDEGFGEGYQNTFEPARSEAYDATFNRLHSGGQFTRKPFYTILVLVLAALLGFSIQYALLYLLRRKEIFLDIDEILLRKQPNGVDLAGLSVPLPAS